MNTFPLKLLGPGVVTLTDGPHVDSFLSLSPVSFYLRTWAHGEARQCGIGEHPTVSGHLQLSLFHRRAREDVVLPPGSIEDAEEV